MELLNVRVSVQRTPLETQRKPIVVMRLITKKLTHPIDPSFRIPFGSAFFQFGPEFNRTFSGNITNTEFAFIPSAETKWFSRNWYTDIYADHSGTRFFHYIPCIPTILRKNGCCIAVRVFIFNCDRFINSFSTHDAQYRPEDLLPRHSHIGFYIVDNCWAHISSFFFAFDFCTTTVN